MIEKFPAMPFRDVLSRSQEMIDIQANRTYKQITVKLWGQGVVLRNLVSGMTLVGQKRFVARKGQFILSRIDARNGAFGLIPEFLDGAIVSNDFPIFSVDESRLIPEYLEWMSKTGDFVELCKAASEGTTNRIRLREELFLDASLVLPSIEEQRRIVMRIKEFASKVEHAQRERVSTNDLTNRWWTSIITSVFPGRVDNCKTIKFGSILSRSREIETIDTEKTYSGIGTRMWGQGAYVHEQKKGNEFNAERYIVKKDQLIYNEVWAHNGAIAIVPKIEGHAVVSRHFHVFDVDWASVLPEFITWIFRSPWFWHQCQNGLVGTSGRGHMRRSYIENIALPFPSLDQQHHIVSYLDDLQAKVDELKRIQAETSAELDALLPSILDKAFKGEL